MTNAPSPQSEEPWEAEVGSLLGGLGPVDPPPGFLAAALDHRPLYAGRTVAALALAAVAVVGAAVLARDDAGVGTAQPDATQPSLQQAVEVPDSSIGARLDRLIDDALNNLGVP